MEAYDVFRDLAIIIIFAKFFGIVARKCKAPQVVGEIVAGLLIGPSVLGLVDQTDFIVQMAEIGVVLLMFSAGLGTDLKELLKTGPVAFLIACSGVFVPYTWSSLLYLLLWHAAVGQRRILQGSLYWYDHDRNECQHYRFFPEGNGKVENKGWYNDFKCSYH